MDKLEELKKQLRELSQEEAEALKDFFDKEMVYSPEHAQEEAAEVVAEKANEVAEIKGETVEENKTEALGESSPAMSKEQAEEDVEAAEVAEKLEDVQRSPGPVADIVTKSEVIDNTKEQSQETSEEKAEENTNSENPATTNEGEQQATPQPITDDIPRMQKGMQSVDEDAPAAPALTTDTGEELPIDYQQIVEAQNAKIAALQAENASLKTKVEGAFGYSAKPANSVKVNRLYDDALDVHFHK